MNMMIVPETKPTDIWGHSSMFNNYFKLNLPWTEMTYFFNLEM